MKSIGITTTVPIEVLLAAGYQPLDLNNIFVGSQEPDRLITLAERAGFPQNCCAWIKGLYGVCMEHSIDTVLGVTTGDCSNTQMLLEVLKLRGVKVITFAYPDKPQPILVQRQLEELAQELGTTMDKAESVALELAPVRRLVWKVDALTWKDGVVSGLENHLWQVSASDFNGDYVKYKHQITDFITMCQQRQPYSQDMLRLGFIGVPPIFAKDLYPFIEKQGASVEFNEIQRQFSMPFPDCSLAEQYSKYTYPYSVFDRIKDIEHQLQIRKIDGIIHYVQAFCHRGIADIIFRSSLHIPVLTLEGNVDFHLSNHLHTRVEAFLEMLRRSQRILSQVKQ